ncbi:MAG: aminoacyl-tRNA hydrolase [Thermodesulfovibrionales bacterium]|nr:aminoacyl-tRNA hydrolase [Thermodesulfovibrionales bacterium]
MWVIAGLGNPGKEYFYTRHNIGYRVIDYLSKQMNVKLKKGIFYELGKGFIENRETVLMKPLTYMNRSGLAVKHLLSLLGVHPDQLIVIHDDIDLEPATIRIKRRGSSGGHKGIESIIQELNTKEFIRIKIGIGRAPDLSVEEYVLSNFTPEEEKIIKDIIDNTATAVITIITKGVEKAMNEFNCLRSKRSSSCLLQYNLHKEEII